MPSFESSILGAHVGFGNGCTAINSLESDDSFGAILVQFARDIRSNSTKNQIAKQWPEHVKQTLRYILRAAITSTPTLDGQQVAMILDTNTFLTRGVIAALVSAISESSGNAVTNQNQMNIMENFKWKIAVSLSSNKCKNLVAPYVAISYDIRDINGNIKSHSAELTFNEFQEMHSTFARVASVMDAL